MIWPTGGLETTRSCHSLTPARQELRLLPKGTNSLFVPDFSLQTGVLELCACLSREVQFVPVLANERPRIVELRLRPQYRLVAAKPTVIR